MNYNVRTHACNKQIAPLLYMPPLPLREQGTPLAPSSLTQMISGLVGQLLMPGQQGQCQLIFIVRAANTPNVLFFL